MKMPATCVVRGDYLASLDGLSEDGKIAIEIKSLFKWNRTDTFRAIQEDGLCPPYFFFQIQAQLLISGAERCDLVIHDAKSNQRAELKMFPNREAWEKIHNAWNDFFKHYAK